MDSQELLAERGPWGCQDPWALEVRFWHSGTHGALTDANMVFSWIFIKLFSKELSPPPPAKSCKGFQKQVLYFVKKNLSSQSGQLSLATCCVC